MPKLSRLAGSTGHIVTVYIQDSTRTDGGGLTGLANNSAGLVCAYKRSTSSAASVVTLDTITTLGVYGTYAAGHGGFREIDSVNLPGFYEFQPPDAAFASGAKSVAFLLRGATNMVPVLLEFELTAVDNQDGVAFGLSRLDAAISTRSTYAGGAVASVTNPVTVGTNNDKTGYSLATPPPTTAQIATAVWTDLTAGSDFATAGSVGALLSTNLDAQVSTRSTYAGADTSGTTTLLSRIPEAITINSGKVMATLDLTQSVPTSNTAQTVGDCLNAARAQGFGKWVLSGTTLTLYAADGTTPVHTFTLDSASAPTQRS